MSLNGKRIVILGGSSGIGFATAEAAARDGAAVVIASSRRDNIDRALAALPAGADGHVVDLTDAPAVRALFQEIGAFDHLVFTAGDGLLLGPLADLDLDRARRFFDLRYWGAFAAAKYGHKQIRPGGSIVLTSGIAAWRPHPGWTLGASVCSAVEGLSRALAVELAPIRVNLVSPGFVRTPLWSDMPEEAREALYRDAGKALPVGRVGEPADIAETYLYLMREGFSTGQTIVVDGGGLVA